MSARRPRDIVIHHSATDIGSAASFDRRHRLINHWDELGYHFVIGNGSGSGDGAIEIGTRWYKQKWGITAAIRPTMNTMNSASGSAW